MPYLPNIFSSRLKQRARVGPFTADRTIICTAQTLSKAAARPAMRARDCSYLRLDIAAPAFADSGD